MTKKTKLNY